MSCPSRCRCHESDGTCVQVRAHVERQINLIATGQADKEAVLCHTLDQFAQKFRHFVTKIERMDALFEASFSPLASSGVKPPLLIYPLLLLGMPLLVGPLEGGRYLPADISVSPLAS